MTLLDVSFSQDDDGNLIAIVSLASEVSTEAATALLSSIGQEFVLTPK